MGWVTLPRMSQILGKKKQPITETDLIFFYRTITRVLAKNPNLKKSAVCQILHQKVEYLPSIHVKFKTLTVLLTSL